MTPTLIIWIKIGIIALFVFVIWNIIKAVRKQKKTIPSSVDEWKKIVPELMFLGLGVFFFFWVEKNFQRQIDVVINAKDRPLTGLYFTNLSTHQPDSLQAYKGKLVILNLWATWCGPCRRELPALGKLQADYKDQLTVLAISDENESVIQQFINEKPVAFVAGAYFHHPLLDSLSSRPVSILLDKDNKVKDVVVGARDYSFFQSWVEKSLTPSK
jgi:thiol-disulfide isomerase/thioredoxin